MTDIVGLLPCPFCGSTDIRKTDNGHEEWLQCEKCGAGGPWIEPPEGHDFTGTELADQWNTRAAYEVMARSDGEKCVFCPDWCTWESDLKKAATKDAEPIGDEELDRFRHALADVHCKSSSAERHEVEYRLQRFGAKLWRKILARLDAVEAQSTEGSGHEG